MKLVTIQTKAAYEQLLKNGFLTANAQYINELKYGVPYQYIVEHMQHIDNRYNAQYPLWAWVKYGGFTSPPKNRLLGFFPKDDEEIVRITFEKPESEMLVSDYIKYHFLLTNEYLPKDKKDKQFFDELMAQKEVSKVLNCSQQVYSNYELGQRDIPTDILIKLSKFYKVSVDYILGLKDDRD